MKKKHKIITFILIIMVIFLVQITNKIPGIYAEQREKTLDTYPATPEGVVETYCQVDFNGGGDYWNRIKKYTVWEDAPGWDTTILVLGYNVRKIKEDNNRAQVIVEYYTVGEYYWDAIGPVFKEIKKKEVLIFKLIKKDKVWKIENPQEPPHLNDGVLILVEI